MAYNKLTSRYRVCRDQHASRPWSARGDRRSRRCPPRPGAGACGTSDATSAVHVLRGRARDCGACDGQTNEVNAVDASDVDPALHACTCRRRNGSRHQNVDDTDYCTMNGLSPSSVAGPNADLTCGQGAGDRKRGKRRRIV